MKRKFSKSEIQSKHRITMAWGYSRHSVCGNVLLSCTVSNFVSMRDICMGMCAGRDIQVHVGMESFIKADIRAHMNNELPALVATLFSLSGHRKFLVNLIGNTSRFRLLR